MEEKVGKLSDVAKNSELDRLASCITYQEKLILELRVRLQVVSHSSPEQNAETDTPQEFHLSAFINRVDRNNRILEEIHKELAL